MKTLLFTLDNGILVRKTTRTPEKTAKQWIGKKYSSHTVVLIELVEELQTI